MSCCGTGQRRRALWPLVVSIPRDAREASGNTSPTDTPKDEAQRTKNLIHAHAEDTWMHGCAYFDSNTARHICSKWASPVMLRAVLNTQVAKRMFHAQ